MIDIKKKVLEILSANNIECNESNIEVSLYDDMGIDSLQIIDLILQFEDEFQIEFDDSELLLENFEHVTDIISSIQQKLRS